MIKNLVTFGCSLTYGHGLRDCFDPPSGYGPQPSKLAWPQLLSDKLNLNCINLSDPGSGNMEILYRILNYNFTSEDCIVVFWSFTDRDIVFANKKIITRISHFNSYPYFKEWTKIHSPHDLEIRSWLYMHHAHFYLKSIGAQFNFIKTNRKFPTPSWARDINELDVIPEDLMQQSWRNGDYALDNTHPGESFHQNLSQNIFKQLDINN
jgi:hypothetical protein